MGVSKTFNVVDLILFQPYMSLEYPELTQGQVLHKWRCLTQGVRSNQTKFLFWLFLDIILFFGILFFISDHYCFGSIIFFPIIVLKYYFISYYTHIISRI